MAGSASRLSLQREQNESVSVTERGPACAPAVRYGYQAALTICALSTLATALLLPGYTYPQGWVSSHFSVMAMQFATHGVLALGGVPIQNMGPLTTSPDAYLNWPPLYPILLSWLVRLAGDGETAQHVLAASLVLTTAAVLFFIVRFECSRLAAVIAALAYLAAPVIAWYGQAGLHLHLALLATVAGLACFGRAVQSGGAIRRTWLAACLACFTVGAFTSWEPCLAAPGLVFVSACRRDMPGFRFGVSVGVVTTAVAVGVFALYWLSYPDSIHALFLRALLRAGFTGHPPATELLPPHALSDSLEPAGVSKFYVVVLLVRVASVGLLGIVGLCFAGRYPRLILGDKPALSYAFAGAASIALLWSLGMANHMGIHDYEALIFAPPAALAAGALMEYLRNGPSLRVLQWVPVAVLLALAAREAATIRLLRESQHDTPLIAFARDVRASTEPNALIVLPDRDMVFVYYSRRHTIRGVMNEQVLGQERQAIFALCPTCPVYLALPLALMGGFPRFAAETPSWSFSEIGTLYRLRPDIR